MPTTKLLITKLTKEQHETQRVGPPPGGLQLDDEKKVDEEADQIQIMYRHTLAKEIGYPYSRFHVSADWLNQDNYISHSLVGLIAASKAQYDDHFTAAYHDEKFDHIEVDEKAVLTLSPTILLSTQVNQLDDVPTRRKVQARYYQLVQANYMAEDSLENPAFFDNILTVIQLSSLIKHALKPGGTLTLPGSLSKQFKQHADLIFLIKGYFTGFEIDNNGAFVFMNRKDNDSIHRFDTNEFDRALDSMILRIHPELDLTSVRQQRLVGVEDNNNPQRAQPVGYTNFLLDVTHYLLYVVPIGVALLALKYMIHPEASSVSQLGGSHVMTPTFGH